MQRRLKYLPFIIALTCVAVAARADDCAICGQLITGEIYLMTDGVTGQQVEVCSNCLKLPRCFICGLPVKDGEQLPDGRWLCARDAKTAVMDVDDVQQIFDQVHDDLDKHFARFTSFPTNVFVTVIDRVDVDSMFQLSGNTFESPNVLGVTQPYEIDENVKRYKISLLTGQPLDQLEEVCAHELSHAWVGENVSPERHGRIARDAEEGFCEMMGYLYMDFKGDEGEKQRVMANTYTRGQVKLFVAAEQQYGFESILDWMRYGVDPELQEGHLDQVRDLQMPDGTVVNARAAAPATYARGSLPPPEPSTLQLQGIMWGGAPSAVINGQSFFMWDEHKVRVGQATETIRCLNIAKNAVEIQNVDSGQQQTLELPAN
jgi:hypothetical protein